VSGGDAGGGVRVGGEGSEVGGLAGGPTAWIAGKGARRGGGGGEARTDCDDGVLQQRRLVAEAAVGHVAPGAQLVPDEVLEVEEVDLDELAAGERHPGHVSPRDGQPLPHTGGRVQRAWLRHVAADVLVGPARCEAEEPHVVDVAIGGVGHSRVGARIAAEDDDGRGVFQQGGGVAAAGPRPRAEDGRRVPARRAGVGAEDPHVVEELQPRLVRGAAEDHQRARPLAAERNRRVPSARRRAALDGEPAPRLLRDVVHVEVGAVGVFAVDSAEDEEPRPAQWPDQQRGRVAGAVRRPMPSRVRGGPAAALHVEVVEVVEPVRLTVDIRHPAEHVEPIAHRRERVVGAGPRHGGGQRRHYPGRPSVLTVRAAVSGAALANGAVLWAAPPPGAIAHARLPGGVIGAPVRHLRFPHGHVHVVREQPRHDATRAEVGRRVRQDMRRRAPRGHAERAGPRQREHTHRWRRKSGAQIWHAGGEERPLGSREHTTTRHHTPPSYTGDHLPPARCWCW
jgi:hypothetical protein